MPALVLLLLCSLAVADDVPAWVLRGMLSVESSSSYRPDGSILYVNRKRGAAGERGPFQVLPSTFRLYAKPGETLDRLETDPAFAEAFTRRILTSLYAQHRSWVLVLSVYHRGRVCLSGKTYAHRVAFRGHNS